MGKVPMIFEIEMTVKEPKNKISVRKKSYGQTGNRSPISNFLIINCPGNHCAGERMSNAIHNFIITWKRSSRQMVEISKCPTDGLQLISLQNADCGLRNLQFGVQSFEFGVSVCIPRTTN